ncbi:MAG: exosortase H-associated membrane protein [Pseudomonadota bacterium]
MMLWLEQRPVARFALAVLALLPICFVGWQLLGSVLAAPAVMASKLALTSWLPQNVTEVSLQGTDMLVVSTFVPRGNEDNLAYLINTRALSYSIPFYTALHLALRQENSLAVYAWNLLVLWVLLALGLVATALKDMLVTEAESFLAAPLVPPADLIALAYQGSALLVPTIAPIALWAYATRESELFSTLLGLRPPGAKPAQRRDGFS